MGNWYIDVEGSTLFRCTLHADFAFYRLDDMVDQSQTNTRTNRLHIRLSLIEWFEDMFLRFSRNPLARISHFDNQLVLFSPYRYRYLTVFRRKLQGVGEQIVHHLVDIVGHEIHFDGFTCCALKPDVLALGIVLIALHIGTDIAPAPVGIAYGGFYFGYVE